MKAVCWLSIKPWSNGVANRCKLKTCRGLLATLFGQALRALALTCGHFGRDQSRDQSRDQICTQVKASFSAFRHPTKVNAS